MKYEVKTIHDDYDCETCGASYAEGYRIYRDGELVHEMKPVAHCLGGDDFKAEDWAIWIIRDLGHDVWIDGWEAAIDTNQDNNQPERIMNTDTPTPRTNEWETYCDECYYHMWRVRRKNERGFNDGFHLNNGEGARQLVELLNKQDSELTAARAEIEKWEQTACDKLSEVCRQIEKTRLVTEQRDKAWKESAIAVEKEWDAQSIGTLLGMHLGQSIRANIEPKIRELIEQRDRLAEAITSIASGAVYEARCIEIARETLQSLTTNEP